MFAGLDQPYLELVAGCASNIGFSAGEYLFREGDPADTFYLVRHGRVTLETFVPGRGAVTIETIDDGRGGRLVVALPAIPLALRRAGARLWSARVVFDGACLRGKIDTDKVFGYELLNRFSPIMVERLQATRLQLLDVYGNGLADLAPMVPRPFRVKRRTRETHDTWTLSLDPVQGEQLDVVPGSTRCCTRSASGRCRSR